MKKKGGKNTGKRSEILKAATDFYRNLYQSQKMGQAVKEYDTSTDEEEVPEILKEETIKAILVHRRTIKLSDQISLQMNY